MTSIEEYADALTRAWARTNAARRRVKRLEDEKKRMTATLHNQSALYAAADALADAALALPDVVKTKQLQAALSKYRKARHANA